MCFAFYFFHLLSMVVVRWRKMKIWLEHDVAQKEISNRTCWRNYRQLSTVFSHKVMNMQSLFMKFWNTFKFYLTSLNVTPDEIHVIYTSSFLPLFLFIIMTITTTFSYWIRGKTAWFTFVWVKGKTNQRCVLHRAMASEVDLQFLIAFITRIWNLKFSCGFCKDSSIPLHISTFSAAVSGFQSDKNITAM